jgi:hypothetical protein
MTKVVDNKGVKLVFDNVVTGSRTGTSTFTGVRILQLVLHRTKPQIETSERV